MTNIRSVWPKRFLAMDMLYGDDKEPIGEWQEFPQNEPNYSCKVLLELIDNQQIFAYFVNSARAGKFFCDSHNTLIIEDKHIKRWKSLKAANVYDPIEGENKNVSESIESHP